jgi:hypothetical protein
MMEAARTSETSDYIQLRIQQYIPEDSELHACRCENLKSHKVKIDNIKLDIKELLLVRTDARCESELELRN